LDKLALQFIESAKLSNGFRKGKILSYVQEAAPGTAVVQRYIELGGK